MHIIIFLRICYFVRLKLFIIIFEAVVVSNLKISPLGLFNFFAEVEKKFDSSD
jgi:hypothetical protein